MQQIIEELIKVDTLIDLFCCWMFTTTTNTYACSCSTNKMVVASRPRILPIGMPHQNFNTHLVKLITAPLNNIGTVIW
jgi:hypothetical protein